MRTGNLIIACTCCFVLIAEWSAPGQLRFGFPFLTEPLQHLLKVPTSASKVRNQAISELDKLAPAQPKDPLLQNQPSRPASQNTLLQLTGKNARSRLPAKSVKRVQS